VRRRRLGTSPQEQRRHIGIGHNNGPFEPPPLLHTRQQAARLLSCSVATLQRLEKSGLLTAIKLNKQSPAGQTYYGHAELVALASGGEHAEG
jgi:hypothetical protein